MDQFLVVCLEHLKYNTIMSKFLEGLKGFAAGFADPSAASQSYFKLKTAPELSKIDIAARKEELTIAQKLKQEAEDLAEQKYQKKLDRLSMQLGGNDPEQVKRVRAALEGGQALHEGWQGLRSWLTGDEAVAADKSKFKLSTAQDTAALGLVPERTSLEREEIGSKREVLPYQTKAAISKARSDEADSQMNLQVKDSILWGGGAKQKADQLLEESRAATNVARYQGQAARQQRLTSAMTTDEMKTLRNANAEQAVSSALSKLDATQQAKTIAAIKDAVIRKAVVTAPDGNVTGFDMSKLTPDERMLWNQTMGILRASGLADLSDADIVQSMLKMLNTGAPATGETFKDDSF